MTSFTMHLPHTILIFATCIQLVCASNVSIYLDKVALKNQYPYCRMRDRTNASDKDSFWMFAGDLLAYRFCLNETTQVTFMDVLASNDGGSDNLEVSLNGEVKGKVTTIERSLYGHYWNEFVPSGQIGNATRLEPGVHEVLFNLTQADFYGMELDSLVLEFDKNVSADDLRCVETSGPLGDNSYIKTCDPGNPRIVADTSPQTTPRVTTATTAEQRHETTEKTVTTLPKHSTTTVPVLETSPSTLTERVETQTEDVGTSTYPSPPNQPSSGSTLDLPASTEYVELSSTQSTSPKSTKNYQQTTEVRFENKADTLTKPSSTPRSKTVSNVQRRDFSAFMDYGKCKNGCTVVFPEVKLITMTLILLRCLPLYT